MYSTPHPYDLVIGLDRSDKKADLCLIDTHTGRHTRVTEWKNIPGHGENAVRSSLTFEAPASWEKDDDERFYPVKDVDGEIQALYRRYAALAEAETDVTFCGRLGQYAYLDMDQAVDRAMGLAEKYLYNDK